MDNVVTEFAPSQTPWTWFGGQIKDGVRYALYFLGIAFGMGMLYGLFARLFIEPGLFATSLVGIFCIINFPVSLLAVLINLLLAIFKKSSRPVYKYFGLSLGFALVYLLYFYGLHLLHIELF